MTLFIMIEKCIAQDSSSTNGNLDILRFFFTNWSNVCSAYTERMKNTICQKTKSPGLYSNNCN